MLRLLREGAKLKIVKFSLFGVLALAMLGMVLMDVAGVFRRGGGVSSKVAEVAGKQITVQEFDRAYRRALQQMGIDSSTAQKQGIVNQVLVQEINRRLMERAAQDAGLNVGPEMVAQSIREILAPYAQQEKGVTEKDLLKRLLYSRNQNEKEFADLIAYQISSGQLSAAVASGAHAPAQLIKDIGRYQNEERKAAYFLIASGELMGQVPQPTDEELQAYYKTIEAGFKTPEYRAIKIAILKPEKIGETLTITDEQLKAAYDERIDEFTLGERRIIEQAVVGSKDTAEKIIAEAQKSGNLQQAVKNLGGETDIYYEPKEMNQGALAKDLSAIAFGLESGGYSEPVETDLGWKILHVKEIVPSKTRSFDEVRAELKKEMIEEAASDGLYKTADKFDDLLAGGATLDEAAQELALPVLAYAPVTRDGTDKNGNGDILTLPEKEKVLETAFSLSENESSPLLETADGGFIAVSVSETIPQRSRDLDETRADVTKMWRETKLRELLKTRSEELLSQMKEGKSLNDLAAALGKTPQQSAFIKRSSKESALGVPEGLVQAVFSLDKPGAGVTFQNPQGMVVASLVESRIVDTGSEEEMKNARFVLDRSMQEDLLTQYRQGLMGRYNVKVHEKTLRGLYDNAADPDAGS